MTSRLRALNERDKHLNIAVATKMTWIGALVYVLNAGVTEMYSLEIIGRRNAESCDDWDKARDLIIHDTFGTDSTVSVYTVQSPRWFASP